MDPYSLKRDNRKKFQDKQRLKNRHATPSDRKYRILNRQEKEAENDKNSEEKEEDVAQPPSNEHRYHEDVTMTFADPAEQERNALANRKIRAVLHEKRQEGSDQDILQQKEGPDAKLTTKGLHSMDVDDLNSLLGASKRQPMLKHDSKETVSPGKRPIPPPKKREATSPANSKVPDELIAAQDFLDDLL